MCLDSQTLTLSFPWLCSCLQDELILCPPTAGDPSLYASPCLGGPQPCCSAPPPWKPRQGNYFWNRSSYTTNELFIFGHGGEEAFCWAS